MKSTSSWRSRHTSRYSTFDRADDRARLRRELPRRASRRSRFDLVRDVQAITRSALERCPRPGASARLAPFPSTVATSKRYESAVSRAGSRSTTVTACSSWSASTTVAPTCPAPMTRILTRRRRLTGAPRRARVRPVPRRRRRAAGSSAYSARRRSSPPPTATSAPRSTTRSASPPSFALGLTPLVFVIAGLIFACTAATYAEGTVRYPEAGGSSSFARHAFNELVSLRRRVGADAQLRHHDRHLGVLRAALPLDLLGAAAREPVGHRRRRRRDRRARRAERRRRPGGGAAQRRPRRRRLRDPAAARAARLRARLQPVDPRRQRPLGRRAHVVEPRARGPGRR